MSRLKTCLAQLRQQKKKALVTYIVSGDPQTDTTLPALKTLVAAGANIIELGIPFSDPMAEGKVIQLGHERALANGTSLLKTLDVVKAFRGGDNSTPVVLMGYANPIERIGYEKFANYAADSGVDGIITVDLPPEEAVALNEQLQRVGIDNIFLLAPTTSQARIKQITEIASGFLYYVSLKGVTGAGHLDAGSVQTKVTEIKTYTDLPVLVGFGIKDAVSAKTIGTLADGVVIGSVLVDTMGGEPGQTEAICKRLHNIVTDIRSGLDQCE